MLVAYESLSRSGEIQRASFKSGVKLFSRCWLRNSPCLVSFVSLLLQTVLRPLMYVRIPLNFLICPMAVMSCRPGSHFWNNANISMMQCTYPYRKSSDRGVQLTSHVTTCGRAGGFGVENLRSTVTGTCCTCRHVSGGGAGEWGEKSACIHAGINCPSLGCQW